MRQSSEPFMQSVDRVDLGDAKRLDLGLLDPARQRPGRGRGGADRVEREQGPRDPAAAQLGAATGAIARLLPSEGLGQPRRDSPELLEPTRDHPAPI